MTLYCTTCYAKYKMRPIVTDVPRSVCVFVCLSVGHRFESQSRRRVTVLGKLFTPIVPLFTKQQN